MCNVKALRYINLPQRERLGEGRATSVAQTTLFECPINTGAGSFAPQTRLGPSPGLSHEGRGA